MSVAVSQRGTWRETSPFPPPLGQHIFATRQFSLLGNFRIVVHIGNEDIHGDRYIMNKSHKTYYFDWLVSRAKYPEKNCIYVWS